MKITPFAVEQWMNAHETGCRYNLAETGRIETQHRR
jgi:hypothetical protein